MLALQRSLSWAYFTGRMVDQKERMRKSVDAVARFLIFALLRIRLLITF
jgi:hypothetical protein